MLRGLIFDFDGTIAETERLGHRLAYNAAFRELGLPWEWDEVLYGDLLAVGGGKERLVHYVKHYQDGKLASSTLGDVISRIHEAKPRHFAALTPTIALRPGIVRIVREAKHARVKLAIATTAALGGVQALLALHPDLSDAFALVAAGDIVVKKKPDPAVYEHVLKTMKWRAHDVVAIEDAAIGLRSWQRATIRAVKISRAQRPS
jgi:beta-phosphoglucomutase-like phosphatase (HAD superfamily)